MPESKIDEGVKRMSAIVLIMWRRAIAQSLLTKLNTYPLMQLCYESDYSQADACVRNNNAKVALIEAAETGSHDVYKCLDICAALRKESENCKLILMCPDQDEEAVAQTVNAKQEGWIDDFVFYETSLEYLSSKILTMLNSQ